MTKRLKRICGLLLDFVFPRQCIGCGVYGDLICINCQRKLPRLLPPLCQRCGRPEASGKLCSECWAVHADADYIRSVFIFGGTVRDAIHELKYNKVWSIAGLLGELMADYYVRNDMKGDVLCPVPLHKSRLKQRGYNQSKLLASTISERLQIPVKDDALIRTRHTASQARAENVKERKQNVTKAFYCQDDSIKGMNIVLIDDVCTSGATIEACAGALKEAGASSVIGFTLAMELLNKE